MDINLRIVDGQGGLESCSPWGLEELGTTEQLNWLISSVYVLILIS